MTAEEQLQDIRRRQRDAQSQAARAEARADAMRENLSKIEDNMKKLGASTPEEAEALAKTLRDEAESKISEARRKMEDVA